MNHSEMSKASAAISHKMGELRLRKTRAEETIQEIETKIEELQSYCTHEITKHFTRATAECDGWDECVVCGATIL